MAIYAVKKGAESNERLLTRFKKQVQETRLLRKLRDGMRFKGKVTKREIRIRALKREEFRAANKKAKFYSNI